MNNKNNCLIPTPAEDVDGDQRWMSIHNRFLSESKEKDADVVFIGDSIIQALQNTCIWNELFIPLHCLNFGIHRDKIENVLWRIKNGELDHVKPKVVVLHVGTNNHQNTPEEVIDGIVELLSLIREKHPEIYIVVPSLLPRGQFPNPIRNRISEVNDLMKNKLKHTYKVELIDIHNGFVQSNGTISHYDMYDYLCLTDSGSKKAFEPVHELLLQLINEGETEIEYTLSE